MGNDDFLAMCKDSAEKLCPHRSNRECLLLLGRKVRIDLREHADHGLHQFWKLISMHGKQLQKYEILLIICKHMY